MNYFLSNYTTKSETISCLTGFIIIGLFLSVLITYLPAFGQTNNTIYSNYTSDKNHIQFQFPADWNIKEKTNRFDNGPDVQIVSPTVKGEYIILNVYDSNFFQGVDFKTATDNLY